MKTSVIHCRDLRTVRECKLLSVSLQSKNAVFLDLISLQFDPWLIKKEKKIEKEKFKKKKRWVKKDRRETEETKQMQIKARWSSV